MVLMSSASPKTKREIDPCNSKNIFGDQEMTIHSLFTPQPVHNDLYAKDVEYVVVICCRLNLETLGSGNTHRKTNKLCASLQSISLPVPYVL